MVLQSGSWTDTNGITGLTASTTYHVRAYAINSVGIAYGSDVTVTTSAPTPVNGVCGTANGQTYPYGSSSYSPYTQCSAGTTNNGVFPAAGSTAYWQCKGLNGGLISSGHVQLAKVVQPLP